MPLKKRTTKGCKPKCFPLSTVIMDEICRSCCIYGGVTEALIVKGHEEVQAIIYLWWTVSNASLMTKCQPFLCAHSPGGHEDLGNVWRNILLCKGFPESRQTIRCSLLCSGCACWQACCSRLFKGFIIQGWLHSSCSACENQVWAGHTGMIKIPFAWSYLELYLELDMALNGSFAEWFEGKESCLQF